MLSSAEICCSVRLSCDDSDVPTPPGPGRNRHCFSEEYISHTWKVGVPVRRSDGFDLRERGPHRPLEEALMSTSSSGFRPQNVSRFNLAGGRAIVRLGLPCDAPPTSCGQHRVVPFTSWTPCSLNSFAVARLRSKAPARSSQVATRKNGRSSAPRPSSRIISCRRSRGQSPRSRTTRGGGRPRHQDRGSRRHRHRSDAITELSSRTRMRRYFLVERSMCAGVRRKDCAFTFAP